MTIIIHLPSLGLGMIIGIAFWGIIALGYLYTDSWDLGFHDGCDFARKYKETKLIVHCRDCKFCDRTKDEMTGETFWKCIGHHYGKTELSNYCNYAEKR